MPATTALLQEGRYRLDHSIAESSESSVFQGYDTVRDTKVVVKEIVVRLNKVTTLAQQENTKLSFVNQAKMLASLKHDSLVQIEDYFSEIGRQYLVLESIEGDDLQTVLDSAKVPFTLSEVAAWADQILDALHYLHNFNPPILHKLVRPKHLRKQIDGRVKLLACTSPDGDTSVSTSIGDDDNDSVVLNYSPLELIWEGLDSASQKVIVSGYDDRSEKILKSPADVRSDVYSVGATLYHLLTAKAPVDPLERSIEMLDGQPDPLRAPHKIDPSIPEDVSDVIMRAMEIKREARFDSAVIMRQVLRTAIAKVQEREDSEARELEEAAQDLKFAEKVRQEQIEKLVEQKARELEQQKQREIEEEKRKAAELLEQKLREAEEMRIAAEARAAEAEQLLKEQEALRNAAAEATIHSSQPTAAAESKATAENLLELTVEPNAAANQIVEEAEVVAFKEEPASAEEHAEVVEEADEPFLMTETGTAIEPSTESRSLEDSAAPAFSYQETKSGSKMPMIAGALVVLVIAAVGGWFFLGSNTVKEPAASNQPASASTAPAVPPAATEQSPAAEPSQSVQSTVAPEENALEVQPASEGPDQSRPAAKPTTAKATKPAAEPAKTPEKKKVTVDDLINDN